MVHFKSRQEHDLQVAKCQEMLQQRKALKPLTLKYTQSNTLRSGEYKHNADTIDLSAFNAILAIDTLKCTATVEPRVTIRELTEATLKYGFIPLIVPEFETITVGGAINGAALESTSHKYGQFNDTCIEYELLLGNGTLLKANQEENSDLFYGMSGSYGTLAILTLVTLKLTQAKKGVRLKLTKFSSSQALIREMQLSFNNAKRPDIIEGGLLAKNWAVLITGSYTDTFSTNRLFSQKHSWDPWYYQQITESTAKADQIEVDMPLTDYLFRFDRGAFWMGRYLLSWPSMVQIALKWRLPEVISKISETASKLTPRTHPSLLFRTLFGSVLSSKRLYEVWHKVPKELSEQLFFIQDFYTPLDKVEEAFETFNEKTGIFPMWLCPILGTSTPQILSPHFSENQKNFINIGLYGVPKKGKPVPELTAECEEILHKMGGRKMLYSQTYYSKKLFAEIYDLPRYEELCKKYFSYNVFLPIYNKIINRS